MVKYMRPCHVKKGLTLAKERGDGSVRVDLPLMKQPVLTYQRRRKMAECEHIWTRVAWTTAYKMLEATTYKGEHRIATDSEWFWPVVQCRACKKVRVDKIYVKREDIIAEEVEAKDAEDTIAQNESKAVGEDLFKKGYHRCSVLP
jgi:hypothetical protein